MRERREIVLWILAGLVGAILLAWAYPRAFPALPEEWSITAAEAEAIALERLRELGEALARPYVVTRLATDPELERRLQLTSRELGPTGGSEAVAASGLAAEAVSWAVRAYAPGARAGDWTYQAAIALDGEVLSLRRRLRQGEGGGGIEPSQAIARAVAYLDELGEDPAAFVDPPTVRRDDVGERTDTVVRFSRRATPFAARLTHGVEVVFAGDELVGFGRWSEDADPEQLQSVLRQTQLFLMAQSMAFALLLLILAGPFLRRYHDGQLGVRRAAQIFGLCLGAGLVLMVLDGREMTEMVQMGFATRRQVTWLVGGLIFTFQVLGLAVLAFVSWSVGESYCRGCGWGQRLASIDALARGNVQNATVALSSLRGVAAGLAAAGLSMTLALPLQSLGVFPQAQFLFAQQSGGFASLVASFAALLAFLLPTLLFAHLVVPCWAVGRLGPRLALPVTVGVAALVVTPPIVALPLDGGFLVLLLAGAVPVLVLFVGDVLSALLAALVQTVAVMAMPLLHASDPRLELSGWLLWLAVASPLLVSLRFLGSDRRFVYQYDDIPPHVRRIAERERQRVELETAARIQSSILPELPPSLHGVEIAHAYLPASEVGGDFYDLLALDDGRLALAVGDVAGHGVSSGLVMSMAKSALSVQVTFDPRVESVLRTLNRLVYQGARQRLLTTLCYGLLDPVRGELLYASAGHLFPYCVSREGAVRALEAGSYPLGVRSEIDVPVRLARLAAGETIFLYSDGLVEAVPDGGDEAFGFERLERALERHAGKPPTALRDAVLAEVEAYRGERPRDDDLTLLVLRLPAA